MYRWMATQSVLSGLRNARIVGRINVARFGNALLQRLMTRLMG
ncbi:hypothetical protein SARI_04025 [Salmonella enterica subsp. arizonae serovar 62:z4,z23:-]|uniref:Uncharacterized protein n=1 Tax=Salmonella arizonae (strain ATCC BAA-731 / CDC346-86 / RSK2980) TaxID=41514 RepID=A9MLJ9_SALAR|nr:hypothetical protein SARI_04025 [Salmonella enterica subsp. arizonae serovar 62:z4,z23:-]